MVRKKESGGCCQILGSDKDKENSVKKVTCRLSLNMRFHFSHRTNQYLWQIWDSAYTQQH